MLKVRSILIFISFFWYLVLSSTFGYPHIVSGAHWKYDGRTGPSAIHGDHGLSIDIPDGEVPITPANLFPSSLGEVGLWSRKIENQDGIPNYACFEAGTAHFDQNKPTVVLVHGVCQLNRRDDGTLDNYQKKLPAWVRETVNELYEIEYEYTDGEKRKFKEDTRIPKLLGLRNDINVLAWNWTQISSITYAIDPVLALLGDPHYQADVYEYDPIAGFRYPGAHMADQGMRLAGALQKVLGHSYHKPIHFMGHSLGSGVATVAILDLGKMGSTAVDQLTLFDAPEHNPKALNPDFTSLFLDNPLREAVQLGIWVDSYPTAFGDDYYMNHQISGVVNFNIKGDINFWSLEDHFFPMNWYFGIKDRFNTQREGTLGCEGGPSMDLGSAWSYVLNNRSMDTDWIDSNDIAEVREHMARVGSYTVPSTLERDTYHLISADTQYWFLHDQTLSIEERFDSPKHWFKQGNVRYVQGTFSMITDSQAFLFRAYEFPADSKFLTFDFHMEDAAPEDRLSLYIGEDPSFIFQGDSYLLSDSNNFSNSGPVNVSPVAGTRQWITFVFQSPRSGRNLQLANLLLHRYEYVMAKGLAHCAWPCRGHDLRHTGWSPHPGALTNTLLWSYQTGGKNNSSPVIGTDGTVYTGCTDHKVYALYPTGQLRWCYKTEGEVNSTPAIGCSGTIYIGSSDHRLYALDPNGSLNWSYKTGGAINSSPTLWTDGTIYVGSDDSRIYALDPNGELKWSYQTGGEVNSSPTLWTDGTIYVGSDDSRIYALDPNGELKWSYQTGGKVNSSPAIGSDGTVYIGSCDGRVYAFDPSGFMKWSYETDGAIYSSPAICYSGKIYIGSCDKRIYAFDPSGSVQWSYETKGEVYSSPAIGNGGRLYIGSSDHRIYALGCHGNLEWSYETGGSNTCSPSIGTGNTVFIGCSDGKVYAFGVSEADDN